MGEAAAAHRAGSVWDTDGSAARPPVECGCCDVATTNGRREAASPLLSPHAAWQRAGLRRGEGTAGCTDGEEAPKATVGDDIIGGSRRLVELRMPRGFASRLAGREPACRGATRRRTVPALVALSLLMLAGLASGEQSINVIGPTAGPSGGGSRVAVNGTGFLQGAGAGYSCVFSSGSISRSSTAESADGATIACDTPAWMGVAAEVGLRVFKDGAPVAHAGAAMQFLFEPSVARIVGPLFAPAASCAGDCWPMTISLLGHGFDPVGAANLDCQLRDAQGGVIDEEVVILGEQRRSLSGLGLVASTTEASCVIGSPESLPVYTAGAYEVVVRYRGAALGWKAFAERHVQMEETWVQTGCPAGLCRGDADGGSTVTVFGTGFDPAGKYQCNFTGAGLAVGPATVASQVRIACAVPRWGFAEEAVALSLVSLGESAGAVRFAGLPGSPATTFTFFASWFFPSRPSGSVLGGAGSTWTRRNLEGHDDATPMLAVTGAGFSAEASY